MSPTSIGVNLRVTGHCSQGGRKYMEDFFSVAYQQSEDEKDLEYAFFGIYDGHGGSEAATYAKEHLMNTIVNQKLFWSDCDEDILRAIREGYIATHYAMWREQEKWPKTATGLPSTAGTTASVAFIRRGKIYIGHVGDSGIVLGYQEEGEKFWRAKPLTHDHKPECNVEKARIINSGGKVVTKSGVPRVVWNRPRIGHKGPVRRSTPIDEIPFLAVARSLGDLWSYNSALNEFVVSPDPDVLVVKIDPKSYRCLIFGTDGLWNVISPSDAIDLARDAEIINEKLSYMGGGSSEWTNPSKCLVDKALERWCAKKMRADNTSVVTIMLDPPGPPKKEIIKNCSTSSYGLEYIQLDDLNDPLGNEYNDGLMQNYSVLDNSTVALFDNSILAETSLSSPSTNEHQHTTIDSYAIPTNGYAIMTSYENDRSCENSGNINTVRLTNDQEVDAGEYHSYQSLDESGIIGQDHVVHHHQLQSNDIHQQQQHQYQQQCMSAEEGYSLTKLETRCEQQFRSLLENDSPNQPQQQQTSSSSSPFQDFNNEEATHSYNQYDSITSSYQQTTISLSSTDKHNEYYNNDREEDCCDDLQTTPTTSVIQQHNRCMNDENMEKKLYEPNLELSTELDTKNSNYTTIDDSIVMEEEENSSNISRLLLDESIQINEISSSVIEEPMIISCVEEIDEKSNDELVLSSSSNVEMKSLYDDDRQKTPRTTRRSIKRLQDQNVKTINISRTRANYKSILIEQNENISIIEPRKLRSTVNCNKRILRSRDTITLAKDMKSKLQNKKQQQQSVKKSINNYLKVSNSSVVASMMPQNISTIRTRQFQQQQQQQQQETIWSPRQKRAKNSPIVRQTAADSSLRSVNRNNKPKTSSSHLSNSPSLSSSSVSSSSSPSSPSSLIIVSSSTTAVLSKKSSSNSRNSSAWCSVGKSAVQTRNRVQKRLSH